MQINTSTFLKISLVVALTTIGGLFFVSTTEATTDCHAYSLWSWSYCSPFCKCDAGEGDCDRNNDCTTDYCAYNVGAKYGKISTMDVCETKPADKCSPYSLWSWNYCSVACPCDAGEGDCDISADCTTGYCASNVGAKYGQIASMDVCENKVNVIEVALSVSPVIDNPLSSIVLTRETADFLKFDLTASGESMKVNKITATLLEGSDADFAAGGMYLYDGTTLLGSSAIDASINNKASFSFSPGNEITIPNNSTKTLTLKGKLGTYISVVEGSSLKFGVYPNASDISAVAVSSAKVINATGIPAIGNSMYVYATKPTVTLNASSPSGSQVSGVNQEILRFNVANANNGFDLNVNSIKFSIISSAGNGVFGKAYKLYQSTDLATVIGQGTSVAEGTKTGSVNIIPTSGNAICSGCTKTYILKADTTQVIGNLIISIEDEDFYWDDGMVSNANKKVRNLPITGNTLIYSVTPTKSITVTSPNGGEQWKIGSTYNIRWTSVDLPSDNKISEITLLKGGSQIKTIVTWTANDGEYQWTVPSDLSAGGDYKFYIRYDENGLLTYDESDVYFSILCNTAPLWDLAHCSVGCKCDNNEGNCTNDEECVSGFCARDVGTNYGQSWYINVCMERPTTTGSCIDSDGGYNIYEKGNCRSNQWDQTATSYVDHCGLGRINEWYCSPTEDKCVSGTEQCPYGCNSQGASGFCERGTANFECTAGTCDTDTRRYCDAGFWTAANAAPYCANCNNCSDTIRNCGETGINCGGGGCFVCACPDNDGDGYQSDACGGNDCNDANASINPGAAEICGNGTDENCDGVDPACIVKSITVTSPNGGEKWEVGKTYVVQWKTIGFNASDPFRVALIRMPSIAGSSAEWKIEDITNAGSYNWTIPATLMGEGSIPIANGEVYKIRIYDLGDPKVDYDDSDNYFSIIESTPTCTDSDNGKDYYTAGTCTRCGQTSCGTTPDICSGSTLLEYYCENNECKEELYVCPYGCQSGACLRGKISPCGSYGDVNGDGYLTSEDSNLIANYVVGKITLSSGQKLRADVDNSGNVNIIDSMLIAQYINGTRDTFSVCEKSITVTSPNGGEQWEAGSTYNIKWTSVGLPSDDKISEITVLKGGSRVKTIVMWTTNDGEYKWTVPFDLSAGDDYKIYIEYAENGVLAYDESDAYFSITKTPSCHAYSLWSWSYCSPFCRCDAGEGDCDNNIDCNTGYCANDVGAKYGQVSTMDVCEEKSTALLDLKKQITSISKTLANLLVAIQNLLK